MAADAVSGKLLEVSEMDSSQPLEGHCACGAVTVSVMPPYFGPFQCFCAQCQRASGGSGAVFIVADRADVEIAGQTKAFAEPTQSINQPPRHFCPDCGTAVFSEPSSLAGKVAVKASMFVGSQALGPIVAAFWARETPPWETLPATEAIADTQ